MILVVLKDNFKKIRRIMVSNSDQLYWILGLIDHAPKECRVHKILDN